MTFLDIVLASTLGQLVAIVVVVFSYAVWTGARTLLELRRMFLMQKWASEKRK